MTILELKRNMRQARARDEWYCYSGVVTCDGGRERWINIRVFGFFLKKFEVDGTDEATGAKIRKVRGIEKYIREKINEEGIKADAKK